MRNISLFHCSEAIGPLLGMLRALVRACSKQPLIGLELRFTLSLLMRLPRPSLRESPKKETRQSTPEACFRNKERHGMKSQELIELCGRRPLVGENLEFYRFCQGNRCP